MHALGVMAYQMLTGRLEAALGVDMVEELSECGAPEWLMGLIKRCVSRDPERRPADGQELYEELREGVDENNNGVQSKVGTPGHGGSAQFERAVVGEERKSREEGTGEFTAVGLREDWEA